MITPKTVLHVAELASLSLDDEEVELLARDLETIVKYVAELERVDTEGVSPMTSAAAHAPKLRADVAMPCLSREEVLSQAPRATDTGFLVPKFVDGSAESEST